MIFDDNFLVRRLKDGDWSAFQDLINRHYSRIFRLLLHDVNVEVEEVARDLTQEVFQDVWRQRDSIPLDRPFKSWLNTVARYKRIDHFSDRSRFQAFAPEYGMVLNTRSESAQFRTQLAELKAMLHGPRISAYLSPPNGQLVRDVLVEMLRLGESQPDLVANDDGEITPRKLLTAAYDAAAEKQVGSRLLDAKVFENQKNLISKAYRQWEISGGPARLMAELLPSPQDRLARRHFLLWLGASAASLAMGDYSVASTPRPRFDLATLDGVRTPHKLIEALEPYDYTYATASKLRDMRNPIPILESAGAAIHQTFWTNPKLAGLVANFFDKYRQSWAPNRETLRRLEHLCDCALTADRLELFHSIEPLVYSLATFGRPEMHRRFLERTLDAVPWRKGIGDLGSKYHGDAAVQLGAYKRHLRHPRRKGLQRAHDAPALIDLMMSQNRGSRIREDLRRLLHAIAVVLKREGEHRMVEIVMPFVQNV